MAWNSQTLWPLRWYRFTSCQSPTLKLYWSRLKFTGGLALSFMPDLSDASEPECSLRRSDRALLSAPLSIVSNQEATEHFLSELLDGQMPCWCNWGTLSQKFFLYKSEREMLQEQAVWNTWQKPVAWLFFSLCSLLQNKSLKNKLLSGHKLCDAYAEEVRNSNHFIQSHTKHDIY